MSDAGRHELIGSRELVGWGAFAAMVVGGSWVLGAATSGLDAGVTVVAIASAQVAALVWSSVWMVGALGVGLALARATSLGDRAGLLVPWCLGIGCCLWLAHALGWLGVMGTGLGGGGLIGRLVSWVPILFGLGVVCDVVRRRVERVRVPGPTAEAFAMVPGLCVMFVAVVSPPGWLWGSEFGGYDALSYHLALPREWMDAGRIATLEHNVYSALPSFLESGWYQLGVMMGGLGGSRGLVEDGSWLLASQALHAWCGVLGALTIGACVERLVGDRGRAAVALTAGVVLATPWIVVTGTLAYNEMVVVLLGGGACLVALRDGWSPATRSWASGLLLAAACGAKPTAFFLLGPTVAALLLGRTPRGQWAGAVWPGVVAGVLVLVPWLARTGLATGNPLFPYATALFGEGWWTPEQAARWAAGHRFDGGLGERLATAFGWGSGVDVGGGDAGGVDGRGLAEVERFRGVFNPQWFAWFPLATLGVVAIVVSRRTRRVGLLLGGGFATGLAAWLVLTHIQSRFLVPLIVPTAVAMGVAASRLPIGLLRPLAGLAIAVQGGVLIARFVDREAGGRASVAAVAGPGLFIGVGFEEGAPRTARAWANQTLGEDARVLLVGDAAGLYWLVPTRSTTTWDTSPLIVAIREHPGDVSAWIDRLACDGFTHVVINHGELDRLRRSGWLDPALSADALGRLVSAGTGRRVFDDATVITTGATP